MIIQGELKYCCPSQIKPPNETMPKVVLKVPPKNSKPTNERIKVINIRGRIPLR